MQRTGIVSLLGLLIASVLYVAVNTLLSVTGPGARLDVTEDGLFTLSQGTHATLGKIDEPIELHFFFSERLGRDVPQYASYARRVREMLDEITTAAKGQIILHKHNPVPFSELEDRAVSFGIQGVPINKGSERAYFGLAGTNSVDDVKVIAFLQPERETLLEYDLAHMIHVLSNPEPTVVGLISSLPILGDMRAHMQGGAMVPSPIGRQLKANFTVVNLPQSIDAFPKSISVMMIVHPRKMSQRAIYELEQFLFRGGRAILLLDPKSEADRSIGPDRTSTSTHGLDPLLKAWGVQVSPDELVADRSMALRINAGSQSRPVPAQYLLWLGIPSANLATNDPVTSQLPALNLATAGSIVQAASSPLQLEPLIASTANSNTVSVQDVRGSRPNILGLLRKFTPNANAYNIAARLTGNVTTAFPNGPPARTIKKTKQELAKDPDAPQLMKSNGSINVILVADTDFLDERFWLQKQQFFGREVERQIAGNAKFVINALGNLSGSDDLLRLRSRGVSQRPFERVKQLENKAERRLQGNERELQAKLKQAQAKVGQLEGVQTTKDPVTGATTTKISLSAEQRAEVGALRHEMLAIRRQLRIVQLSLRKDVERLETWIQFINIGLIPIIVAGIAIILASMRLARRRRYHVDHRDSAVS